MSCLSKNILTQGNMAKRDEIKIASHHFFIKGARDENISKRYCSTNHLLFGLFCRNRLFVAKQPSIRVNSAVFASKQVPYSLCYLSLIPWESSHPSSIVLSVSQPAFQSVNDRWLELLPVRFSQYWRGSWRYLPSFPSEAVYECYILAKSAETIGFGWFIILHTGISPAYPPHPHRFYNHNDRRWSFGAFFPPIRKLWSAVPGRKPDSRSVPWAGEESAMQRLGG